MMEGFVLKCGDDAAFKPARSEVEGLSTWFHSDTLWSALVNIYAQIRPNGVDDFIELFERDRVRISSAFPCLERPDGSYLPLLPKPKKFDAGELDHRKAWKKIQWICPETLKKGSSEGLDPADSFGRDIFISETSLGFSPRSLKKKPKFFVKRDLPKVKAHSQESTDSFYYLPVLHLRQQMVRKELWKPHFYFLLEEREGLPKEVKQRLLTCIHLIADTGLGGEKSSGCGQFVGIGGMPVDWIPKEGSHSLGLSMVHPIDQEEVDRFVAYDTRVRGGGPLGNPEDREYYRKRIRMIGEGAVSEGEVQGCIRDVSPEKNRKSWPIYRYGKSFCIPFSPQTPSP